MDTVRASRFHPRQAWHLLWTLPLGIALAALPFLFGNIAMCGVSGCGGGGFGPAYGPDYEWIIPFCVSGLAIGLGVFLPPWGPWRFRALIGGLVAAGIAALLIIGGFVTKYPTLT